MAVQPVFFHSGQYRIKTDLYQGPLDLLLDLIEKAELDITVLSLAQVTDQFLEYVRAMEEENARMRAEYGIPKGRVTLAGVQGVAPPGVPSVSSAGCAAARGCVRRDG